MTKNHLKRMMAPRSWPVGRKKTTFIVRPRGYLRTGLPVSLILTEFLNLVGTRREVKRIVQEGKVSVDGRVVKDERRPLVLMSVMQVEGVGTYRLLLNSRGKLCLAKVLSKDAKRKFCKVVSKKAVKKGRIQLGFHEGTSALTENRDIKINDTVVVDPSKNSIESHLKFEKGSRVFLTGGRGVGSSGTVETTSPKTAVKIGGLMIEIDKKNVFVIDDKMEVDQK